MSRRGTSRRTSRRRSCSSSAAAGPAARPSSSSSSANTWPAAAWWRSPPTIASASRNQVKAVSCVADAKSAIRYVRQNAARLGVDPNRLAAGGGSAGGHLAACTGVIQGFDEAGEDTSISSVPNALALFNPAVALAPVDGVAAARRGQVSSFAGQDGDRSARISRRITTCERACRPRSFSTARTTPPSPTRP